MAARSQYVHTNIHGTFLGNGRHGKYYPIQVTESACCSCVNALAGTRQDDFETYSLHRQSWPSSRGHGYQEGILRSLARPTMALV